MFSSIASFIFGSSTSSDITDREIKPTPTGQQEQEQRNSDDVSSDHNGEFDIIVHAIGIPIATQCSNNVNVTGRQDRRGKHNKRNKQQKRKGQKPTQQNQHQQQLQLNKPTTSIPTPNSTGVTTASKPIITKLLTTSSDSFEEYSEEEDGWLFVEKEDEDDSSPRTDSEAEVPVVRPSGSSTPVPPPNYNADHFSAAHPSLPLPCLPPSSPSSTSSSSGFTGPRHLQQRNSLQKARNSGARGAQQRLQFTQLSPLRSVARNGAGAGSNGNILLAASVGAAPTRLIVDTGLMAQSLYAVPIYGESTPHNTSGSSVGSGASGCMDESWYVTPPPCFTSIGPIHMETSPFENLLIEHPSMSVYHSIRSAQEAAADGFANIDLGADESTTSRSSSDRERVQRRNTAVASRSAVAGNTANRSVAVRNPQAQTPSAQRTARAHIETLTATQLKQQLLAHKDQKHREKRERQSYGRSVLKRANLVHEHHNKRNWGGRADKQQQKLFSVNATRKY